MPARTRALLRVATAALAFALPIQTGLGALLHSGPALARTARGELPPPYVSRALGAVLIEITPEVRAAYRLKKKKEGVLILSVMPGGVAARQGLKPGDIIDAVKNGKDEAGKKTRGKVVHSPQELDALVLYWIDSGFDAFYFVGSRSGAYVVSYALITLADYDYAYDLASLSAWDSDWEGASYAASEYSYSYSEYVESYSVEITESYETSSVTTSEITTSEAFVSEVSASGTEMTAEEEAQEEAVNEDQATDEEETADFSDAASAEEEAVADEAAVADDSADGADGADGADDSGFCECGTAGCDNPECPPIDEGIDDGGDQGFDADGGPEDDGAEDGGAQDDGGGDDQGGGDGGDEEIVE